MREASSRATKLEEVGYTVIRDLIFSSLFSQMQVGEDQRIVYDSEELKSSKSFFYLKKFIIFWGRQVARERESLARKVVVQSQRSRGDLKHEKGQSRKAITLEVDLLLDEKPQGPTLLYSHEILHVNKYQLAGS